MKRILLIDDSATARLISKTALPKDKGYIIDEANSCDVALERARENLPDLVLCDFNMPGKNGVETALEFKNANLNTRFILVSANLQQKVVDAANDAGYVAILRKPLKKDKIVACLEEIGL